MNERPDTAAVRRPPGAPQRPALRRSATLLLVLLAAALPVGALAQTIETTPLDPDFEMAFGGVVTPAPGYGYVAAWGRGKTVHVGFGHLAVAPDRVMSVWLGPDGTPLTPLRELDEPDDDIEDPFALASAFAGEAVVALSTTSGTRTRRFRFDGSTPEPLHAISPCATSADRVELVAAGGGYWLVSYEACDEPTLLARRLDRSGASQGEAVQITGPESQPRERFGVAATVDGGFWVAWNQLASQPGSGGRVIMARRYGPDGAPVTDPAPLRSFLSELRSGGPDLALLPDGGALVAWNDRTERIFLRAIDADGVPDGPPIQASDTPAVNEFWPQIAISGLGVSAASWRRITPGPAPNQCVLRLFDTLRPEMGEEAELDTTCIETDDLQFGPDGSLLVLSHEYDQPPGSLLNLGYYRPRIAVLPTSQTVHPPGAGFVPTAAPGFRVWVRIGGDEPDPRIGRPEPTCLPETACVSGAIPGRSEVFVRMVGPKPNGYLWPTIVRFTTSTVEVWIEQTATGAVRYYHLGGAEPGSDDLTGGFDRMGFMPF